MFRQKFKRSIRRPWPSNRACNFRELNRIVTRRASETKKITWIIFTTSWCALYISWWYSKVNDGQLKLFITDSSSTHLHEETIRLMRKQRVVIAVIPKGCTMYIQSLDVHVFSTVKHHHYECAEEWLERNGGRSKIKLTAALFRILCTRLVSTAWSRTLNSIDPMASFLELGYMWSDNSLVRPSSVPGYCFDPINVDYWTDKDPNVVDDQCIEEEEEEARKATEEHNRNLDKNTKQKFLLNMWRKN